MNTLDRFVVYGLFLLACTLALLLMLAYDMGKQRVLEALQRWNKRRTERAMYGGKR